MNEDFCLILIHFASLAYGRRKDYPERPGGWIGSFLIMDWVRTLWCTAACSSKLQNCWKNDQRLPTKRAEKLEKHKCKTCRCIDCLAVRSFTLLNRQQSKEAEHSTLEASGQTADNGNLESSRNNTSRSISACSSHMSPHVKKVKL